MRAIDADALEKEGWSLHRTIQVDKNTSEYQTKPLRKVPTIEPEPHWIPVSERLPEELEEVNVTWVNHKPEPYYDFVKDKPFTASAVYYKGDWYWYSSICADLLVEYGKNEIDKIDGAIEIMAWMPLPEPYREGEGC